MGLFTNLFKQRDVYLDGIEANVEVEVKDEWYDSTTTHKVVWEDIYNVYHLAQDGSENAIKKLQEKYKMKHDNYSIDVTVRTPILYEKENTDYYHTFRLSKIKQFYIKALEHQEWLLKREQKELERKRSLEENNKVENLTKSVKEIMNEK